MAFDIDVALARAGRTVGVRFVVGEGLTVLVGPSGAGKTSVLDMIAGLVRPDRGHVRIAGTTLFDAAAGIDLKPEARRIGYVFQDARLFPHLRVRANLLYGHRLAPAEARWINLPTVTGFLGIGGLLDRFPRTLSGGEAQRVAIGRALLSGARCLLMDEPLAALDASRRAGIMTAIERIRDELRLPILYVTHDAAEADRLATHRIAIGDDRHETVVFT